MSAMSSEEIKRESEEASEEVKDILDDLESVSPGITEGAAATAGAAIGAGGSLVALSTLGTAGLSAAGITSGLATAGALVGGGMVAGISVLAAPIALLGIGAFALAGRKKKARLAAALRTAIEKLYAVQSRLLANAEHFKVELQFVNTQIARLSKKAA